jgi:hypothetical protein
VHDERFREEFIERRDLLVVESTTAHGPVDDRQDRSYANAVDLGETSAGESSVAIDEAEERLNLDVVPSSCGEHRLHPMELPAHSVERLPPCPAPLPDHCPAEPNVT